MPTHHPSTASTPHHPSHAISFAATAAIILLALGACSAAKVPNSPGVAPSIASFGTGAHAATRTGAGSTLGAPFFDQALAQYHQRHPAAAIGNAAVGSSAGFLPDTRSLESVASSLTSTWPSRSLG